MQPLSATFIVKPVSHTNLWSFGQLCCGNSKAKINKYLQLSEGQNNNNINDPNLPKVPKNSHLFIGLSRRVYWGCEAVLSKSECHQQARLFTIVEHIIMQISFLTTTSFSQNHDNNNIFHEIPVLCFFPTFTLCTAQDFKQDCVNNVESVQYTLFGHVWGYWHL